MPAIPAKLQDRFDFYTETQLWPLETTLNPASWLNNFTRSELPFAIQILESFMYFPRHFTTQLFSAAFERISSDVIDASSHVPVFEQWKTFLSDVVITYVSGEDPSPTDSGYVYARRAKQTLGVNESQIVHPEEALQRIARKEIQYLVFVDDFVGSGDQFIDTWNRPYPLTAHQHSSFADEVPVGACKVFYCPLFCAWLGLKKIKDEASATRLLPAQIISQAASVVGSKSEIWNGRTKDEADRFLLSASRRAGITHKHLGHRDQGLLIAFEHGVPDATLPLITHSTPNWHPLIQPQ